MPLDTDKYIMAECCSKIICKGCDYANQRRELEERLGRKCEFCREPTPDTEGEGDKQRMKRVEANDPVALCQEGLLQDIEGEGDYGTAFNYYSKAAELGDVAAHYQLATLYHNGYGVEKDRGKEIHHLEEAAIGGHPSARYNLGCDEWNNDNAERAVKHWIIAATQGYDDSIKALMNEFRSGIVSKEDLAAALRAHQIAVDSTKSPHREVAEKYAYKP